MSWPPDIADELPAPQEDDPPSLRRDILDELADHLSCAFTRELHLTAEESRARHNVINRFGDPAKIARKLWFDALKEKIMSQRIVLVAVILVALTGVASTGMSWLIVTQSRELNQQLLAQSRDATEQGRKTNEALLAKLEKLSVGPAPATEQKSMEWNPVKVRLSLGEKGGRPAAGASVSMHGHLLDTAKEIDVFRRTGPDGIADFGVVRPGQHTIDVTTPWGESMATSYVTVLPGQEFIQEFVCPPALPKEGPVTYAAEWPDDLAGKPLWLICEFLRGARTYGETSWTLNSTKYNARYFAMISSQGEIRQFQMDKVFSDRGRQLPRDFFEPTQASQVTFGMYYIPGFSRSRSEFTRGGGGPPPSLPPTPGLCIGMPREISDSKLKWLEASYYIVGLAVTQNPADTEAQDMISFPVIAAAEFSGRRGSPGFVELPSEQVRFNRTGGFSFAPDSGAGSRVAGMEIPKFEAKAGEQNAWKISLPTPLLERVRTKLAEPPATNSTQKTDS